MTSPFRVPIAALGLTGLLLAGCGSNTDPATASSGTASSGTASSSGTGASDAQTSDAGTSDVGTARTLTVFAAASLKATFTELGATFESEHPGVEVSFSFAGSSDLITQLQGGAPADVFASADTATMTKATDAGLVMGSPVDFATNTLTIVTPPDNPAGITSFADLAGDGVSEVVCAPVVPCGSATRKLEDATGITLTPVSEEQSVTDVLNKVESGEADAGLVYVTDATNAGDKVTTVAFPESSGAVNTYPIGVLEDSADATLAQDFVDLVTGSQGQAVLRAAGFAAAP